MSETETVSNPNGGNDGYGIAPRHDRILWSIQTRNGSSEEVFEEELALATLLLSGQVHLNEHWWEDSWPEAAKATFNISVNCNDVFAWGCSDSESMRYSDLREVYDHYAKDPEFGLAIWCMKKRKELPQQPVAKIIAEKGLWDIEKIKKEFGLRNNHYDGISGVIAAKKYATYKEWKESHGEKPLPFDKNWWSGWNEYTENRPDWYSEEWKAEEETAIAEWRISHGYGSVDNGQVTT